MSFRSAFLIASMLMAASALNAAGRTIEVNPQDDLQKLVATYPAGTNFHLHAGIYRGQQIRPKDHDTFIGDGPTTMLTGSVVLSSFQKLGPLFKAHYDAPREQVSGSCTPGSPMCSHPEDCFLDDKPLHRVAQMSQVVSGSWYLDYDTANVVIGDNPAGRVVEVSTAHSAFSGGATDVIISNLAVESYATPAQVGAIGDQVPGLRWQISKCLVRHNHGAGIEAAGGSVITANKVFENGQLGIGAHGDNVVVRDNEIAYNNFAGFNAGWEAGGTKFSHTNHLNVVRNNSHDNHGAGLWTDIDNRDVIYDSNKVLNNDGAGIQHEISFAAKITNNLVSGNGKAMSVWLWGSQILIQNSSDVDVSHNTVVVAKGYGNGIGVVIQNRGQYLATRNSIHDNDITYLSARGASGVVCDYEPKADLVATNTFDNNTYHVNELGRAHWYYKKAFLFDGLQGGGQEVHGHVDSQIKAAITDTAKPVAEQ